MHAERLRTIAARTLAAFSDAGITSSFEALIATVRRRLSNPADPAIDTEVSTRVKELLTAIEGLEVANFPPTWRKLMSELRLDILFPESLREMVEIAFSNRRVDSDLLTTLEAVNHGVGESLEQLQLLLRGLEAVGISEDVVPRGEIEFDVAMPRESIDDNLSGINKEFNNLNRQLLVLAEICKQAPPPLRVNSISTNDFTVALNINIDLGEIIAFVLVALTSMRLGYQSKFDALKQDAFKDLPREIFDQMKAWANGYVKEEISKIVDRLPDACPESVSTEKLEAQKGPVRAALEYIEEKQEAGFNMEVRVGDPPTGGDGQDEGRAAELAQINARLIEIAKNVAQLKVLERQTTPILSLTDQTGDHVDS
ncbi:MAG TPA: hypothetical protein VGG48_08655 [Rhizomicrobium sp.]|jgi:hypothetical protein